MKKTTIYVLIGMLAITTSCKEEANQKKVPKEEKEVFVTDSSYDPEAALAKMGIELKTPTAPVANYVNIVRSGNLIFLSGKGPSKEDGSYITGKLGKDLSIEEGYEAARMTGINQLVVLKAELGNLNRVKRIVKTFGMVNASPEFESHPEVINGFSDLMVAVFGERGKHARSAVGMGSLPRNIAVEIEVIVEVE